jgi:hypothetical protein
MCWTGERLPFINCRSNREAQNSMTAIVISKETHAHFCAG